MFKLHNKDESMTLMIISVVGFEQVNVWIKTINGEPQFDTRIFWNI